MNCWELEKCEHGSAQLKSRNKSQQPILLVQESSLPKLVRSWALAHHADWDWMFLSGDYLGLQRWRSGLGDCFSYISIAQELELSAQRLKKPYLRWLSQLGHNHPEPAWWASRISERNTLVSPLFENVCRLASVEELINKSCRPVLIVSDNAAMLEMLQQVDWLKGRKIFRSKFIEYFFSMSSVHLERKLLNSRYVTKLLFVFRTLQLIKHALQSKFASNGSIPSGLTNAVLLHTFVDETNFSTDFVFRDRYFPGLEEFLKRNGFEVLVLPVMFNLTRSIWNAWSWTKSSPTNFINPFTLYHFVDYIFALRTAYRTACLPIGPLRFEGNDIAPLVKAEAARTSFDSLLQILYLRLPLRLRNCGVNCLALIAEFENMIPEKMLILGFRSHQPSVELIGFQHSAIYPNLLCQYSPIEERDIAPTYDRVVCNGSRFRDVLISEGLTPDIAVVGAALRYKHLWTNDTLNGLRCQSKSIDIFVPLSMVTSASVELLDKLLIAFGSDATVCVMLKAHPMTTIDIILSASRLASLPAHFRITKDAVDSILPHTRVMVGLSTCTMFEAVAAGVPVVRVHRESALDLDPLAYLGGFSPSVRTGPELSKEVQRLLNLSDAERAELYQEGRKILAESFHPCDIDGLNAFLPSKARVRAIA